jgi:hypothetical protein
MGWLTTASHNERLICRNRVSRETERTDRLDKVAQLPGAIPVRDPLAMSAPRHGLLRTGVAVSRHVHAVPL